MGRPQKKKTVLSALGAVSVFCQALRTRGETRKGEEHIADIFLSHDFSVDKKVVLVQIQIRI